MCIRPLDPSPPLLLKGPHAHLSARRPTPSVVVVVVGRLVSLCGQVLAMYNGDVVHRRRSRGCCPAVVDGSLGAVVATTDSLASFRVR